LAHLAETQLETIKQTAVRLLNNNVLSIETIGGGRNSQVYRVIDTDTQVYALKAYFRHASDKRDRLGTEFSSLKFLWNNGIRNIPRPLKADREANCALYEYIDGQKIATDEITPEEIQATFEFLTALKALRERQGSDLLAPASEACFSIKDIVHSIRRRLQAFDDRAKREVPYPHLYEFLDDHLIPTLEEIATWAKTKSDRACISFAAEISLAERTLSPSDFGLHNALKRENGNLVFLDFEYFGWDDPAKMIVDMLLHPAMTLTDTLKRQFVSGILSAFTDYPYLGRRVEIVYPLFGLKWCLILLNEFLPAQLARRQFAGMDDGDRVATQMKQLDKARHMLQTIGQEYQAFPYFD